MRIVGEEAEVEVTSLEMGFYAKHILPRCIDLAMKNREAARLRAESVPQACGDVLEIGIGSGLNLPFYSSAVRRVCGIDPSPELHRMAQRRAQAGSLEIEFLLQSAEERVPAKDASFDTVVVTWSLCSIPNPCKALEQVRRVLKPDGRLIFIEHGRAPDPGVAAWQDRLTPTWKRVTGGCHLNRKVDYLIEAAGFQITDLKTRYLPGPRAMSHTYQGIAQVRTT